MSKPNDMTFGQFCAYMLFLLACVPALALSAHVLQAWWAWFLVPVGLHALTIWQALALQFVPRLLGITSYAQKTKIDDEADAKADSWDKLLVLAKWLISSVIRTLGLWLIGYVLFRLGANQ